MEILEDAVNIFQIDSDGNEVQKIMEFMILIIRAMQILRILCSNNVFSVERMKE